MGGCAAHTTTIDDFFTLFLRRYTGLSMDNNAVIIFDRCFVFIFKPAQPVEK
jgi:hypothetical protein